MSLVVPLRIHDPPGLKFMQAIANGFRSQIILCMTVAGELPAGALFQTRRRRSSSGRVDRGLHSLDLEEVFAG